MAVWYWATRYHRTKTRRPRSSKRALGDRNERLNPTPPPPKTQDVAASKLQSRIRGKNDRERLARRSELEKPP